MAVLRRVRTVFTGVAGTPWYSNLYFDAGVGSPDIEIDLVRDFWTTLNTAWGTGITATIEGDVARIESTTGQVVGIDSGTALTVAGAGTGTKLPPATQGVLHLFTSSFVGGRQLRGKVFIPGLIQSISDGLGAPNTSLKTLFLNAGNTLMTASNTSGNWQVWSKKNLVAADVTSLSTPSKFGVLRSRRD